MDGIRRSTRIRAASKSESVDEKPVVQKSATHINEPTLEGEAPPHVAPTFVTLGIKAEPLEQEHILADLPEAMDRITVKAEPEAQHVLVKKERQACKAIKRELSDDEEAEVKKPKAKRTKKEKAPQLPARLQVTADMKRPPGKSTSCQYYCLY